MKKLTKLDYTMAVMDFINKNFKHFLVLSIFCVISLLYFSFHGTKYMNWLKNICQKITNGLHFLYFFSSLKFPSAVMERFLPTSLNGKASSHT